MSNQKGVVGKEALGLTSKSKGKRRNRNKRSLTLMDIFVKEGEGTQKDNRNKGENGSIKKGKTIPTNTADKLNSYYVLCRASDGHVYADLLVPTMSTLNGISGLLRPFSLT